jgi:DNA polymerase (family 10)
MNNKKLAEIFREMAEMLDISGEKIIQRINAYKKAAAYLDSLAIDVSEIYKKKGIDGLKVKKIIGEKNAKKIEEYLKTGKIKEFEKLKQETAIRQLVTYYFQTKGLSLKELKQNAKKRKII